MKHSIFTIAKYTCLEAARNRLLPFLLIGIVIVFGLGQFVGDIAITETRQIQAGILAFILRFTAVLIVSLFVISSLVREFNDNTVNMIISLPVPRYFYYFGKLAGFAVLALVVAVLMSMPLWLYSSAGQTVLWTISLLCELLIIISVSMLFILTLENIPLAFTAVTAFYLLARSINAILLIGQSPILESTAISQKFMNALVVLISFVLPDLDKFTQTGWLVYSQGTIQNFCFIGIQTLVYMALLSAAALFDLYRKNF